MKITKIINALAIVSLLLVGCDNRPIKQYTLEGELTGIPDSTVITLNPVLHEKTEPLAEILVINGKFSYKDTINEPRAIRVKFQDGSGSKYIMLEHTDIKLSGKIDMKEQNGYKSYDWSNVSVTGSPLSNKYHELLYSKRYVDSIYRENRKHFSSLNNEMKEAYEKKDNKLAEKIKASEKYKELERTDSIFFETVKTTYNKLYMDNKDTFWGPLMLISNTVYLTSEFKDIYESFSQEAKDSYYGCKVREELYPAGKEGEKVPNFSVTDNNGKSISLTELCKDKKYILIDFWASWCNPCRKEIPNLKKLYAKYAKKGFQIISISIDKKETDWLKALKEENLTWPNFLDNGDVATSYKVKMIPSMYLIDTNGIMIGENLRGESLNEKLSQLLGK